MSELNYKISYTQSGLADIKASLQRHGLWLRMGIRDVALEHARAALGILWPLIGALGWITIVYLFLGSSLSDNNPTYLAYLTIGIITYNYASGILVGGVSCFQRFKGVILNLPNPLFIYPLRLFVKVAFGVSLQTIFIIGALFICKIEPSWNWLYILPGLFAFAVTGVFLSLIMGIVGIIVGDLRFLMQSVMRLLMFATPIFWYPSEAGARMIATQYNPLAHYISIIRDPLLGQPINMVSIWVVVGCTVASIAIGMAMFHRSRNDIVRKL